MWLTLLLLGPGKKSGKRIALYLLLQLWNERQDTHVNNSEDNYYVYVNVPIPELHPSWAPGFQSTF